jgi:hypothetical protein
VLLLSYLAGYSQSAFADPVYQVELELRDLQTKQSTYYKFDPDLGTPPLDKPQIIPLYRWQSQRTERNTSVLVKAFKKDSAGVVTIRFRGGQGAVEGTFTCGPDSAPTPNAVYTIYIQTKQRYEAIVTHNCRVPRNETSGE